MQGWGELYGAYDAVCREDPAQQRARGAGGVLNPLQSFLSEKKKTSALDGFGRIKVRKTRLQWLKHGLYF